MNQLVGLLAALAAFTAFAGERVPLWPEREIPDFQPQQIGAMTDEVSALNFKAAEHRMPYIEWCDPPAPATRPTSA